MGVEFGEKIRISLFGESHGAEIGAMISGMPRGEMFDSEILAAFMKRRAPSADATSTARREADEVFFAEGIEQNGSSCMTDGGRIVAVIRNSDVRSSDYDSIRGLLRPGHADLGAYLKYGTEGLRPGGGVFSGRMTAPMCAAGGIMKQLLAGQGITVDASVVEIGGCTEKSAIDDAVSEAARAGDSLGGVIRCVVGGFPGGVGGAVWEGLEGRLAQAMFAIPAIKGIEFGSGFAGSRMTGYENNDEYVLENGRIISLTDNHGGIIGGISTGMDIRFDVAVKPVPSISKEQRTVDVIKNENALIQTKGRHDVCIVPRAVPVVEAMTAFTLYDRLRADEGE